MSFNFFENRLKENSVNKQIPSTYVCKGKTEYRLGLFFFDNKFSQKVDYSEFQNEEEIIVNYNVGPLSQSLDSLVGRLNQDFQKVLSRLKLGLDKEYEIKRIYNHKQILVDWQQSKKVLFEKYSKIPDFENTLNVFEKNLSDETQLIDKLFNSEITTIFFPKIKTLYNRALNQASQVNRTKKVNSFFLNVPLFVNEKIKITPKLNNTLVQVNGTIDWNKTDESKFLMALSLFCKERVEKSMVNLNTQETYLLSPRKEYVNANLSHKFDVDGLHFRRNYFEYKLIEGNV